MENTPFHASGLHRLTYLAACATLTVVVSVSVSACTTSPTTSGPANPTASAGTSPAGTSPPGSPHTSTPAPSPHTSTPAPSPHTTTPPVPAGPPSTGGGGTAGLQDGLLFGIGGAAVLAGLGSLAYRRRLSRQG